MLLRCVLDETFGCRRCLLDRARNGRDPIRRRRFSMRIINAGLHSTCSAPRFLRREAKTQGDDGARFARMPCGPLGRFSVYVPASKEMLLVSAAGQSRESHLAEISVEPRLSRSLVRIAALLVFARTLEKPGTLLEGRSAEYLKIGSGP
jgi:hypothetical protein